MPILPSLFTATSRSRMLVLLGGLALAATAAAAAHRLLATGQPPCPPPGYCVSVTPDGDTDPIRDAGGSYTTSFTLTNTGTQTDSYDVGWCVTTGGVTCTWSGTSFSDVPPGGSRLIKFVSYTVGGSNGTLRIRAEGTALDTGYKYVVVRPAITITSPGTTTYSRMPLVQATFFPNDANLDTATLVVTFGGDTVTNLTRRNRGLVEWEVDSLRQLSPGVAKTLSVRICLTNGQCNTATRSVTLDNSGKPWVSFAGMPLEAQGRMFGAPFGPGLSVSGAEVETGFSLPSYVSMGASRSVALVYSTRQSHPRALVNADIELSWPTGNPDQLKAVLLDGALRLDSVVLNSPSCEAAVGRRCRVALQGDFASSSYGRAARKWLKVEVTVTSGGSSKVTTDSAEVVLVDRRTSPYGSGWWLSGQLRLDSAGTDMILVGPTGSATVFRGKGGRYLSPPRDYSVLVWTGSAWELSFRGGGKLVFDAQGRLTAAVDIDANQVSYSYSGSTDRVTAITDPTSHAFSLSYDGNGQLQSFSDPASRQSRVTINGSSQLVYDSASSPSAGAYTHTYSYTGSGSNGAIVISSRANALGHTTTVSYSSRYRPTQVTLPSVKDESGSSVNPVIQYAAQETRALGTLVSADSVYVSITDPRGNWTRSTLNRWGAPIATWDALGTIARASYTAEGFVAWGEGKVADSTRVHHTFDLLGRLVRSYRWRSPGDMVRLDSLVYDANHRVTQRVDPRGKITRFDYDSPGHVIRAISPSNDTTRYWYRSDGLLDSARSPGQTSSTRYGYETTWRNLQTVTDAQGTVISTNYFDDLGRTTESRRRLTVQASGGSTEYQWRRSLPAYTVANRVDSVRIERTLNCTPCSSGPPSSWPSTADSTRWQRVRVVPSRLGLDSVRIDSRGRASTYLHDALGRLISRTTITGETDSFRYDVAGNLRFHYTRRGYTIEHRYDSRNRDTLTIVPTVGSYRRAFAGPNDELTRLWIDNYLDSIGGVNPEVRWGYSQAGLVLADTSQGGYANRYYADRYGRDTLITDLVGSWRLAHETDRGVLDSVITPWADTLTYTLLSRGQLRGPTVRNGGSYPDLAATQLYTQLDKLRQLTTTFGSYTPGELVSDSAEQAVSFKPVWSEERGGGGPLVTMKDTLQYDGWNRVTAAAYYRNDSLLASESFSYDATGNIFVAAEQSRSYGETQYNPATDRLTNRRWDQNNADSYSYDPAGNLVNWFNTLTDDSWDYGYDALDRLVSVRFNGQLIARYAYDALGRRIVKRVYGSGPYGASPQYLRMIYRGSLVLAEADSGGTLGLSYTWGLGADDLVAIHRHSDGRHLYVVQDGLRSVRGLVRRDGSGTWEASFRYRLYGAVLDSAGSASVALRYRWIGRELDQETGFYYVRSRYYDPGVQRFTQEDPIGYAGGSNLYAYGDGNPTDGRDLDGLSKEYDIAFTPIAMRPRPECLGTWVGCHEPDPMQQINDILQIGKEFLDNAAFDTWMRNAQAACAQAGERGGRDLAICAVGSAVFAEATGDYAEQLEVARTIVHRAVSGDYFKYHHNTGSYDLDVISQAWGFGIDAVRLNKPKFRAIMAFLFWDEPLPRQYDNPAYVAGALRAAGVAYDGGTGSYYYWAAWPPPPAWLPNCQGRTPVRIGRSGFC